MKKLQLFKHIAGELAKGKTMLKGEKDNDNVFFTNGYIIWIIPKKEDIFKDIEGQPNLDYMFKPEKIKNLKLIDGYFVVDNEEIKRGQKIAVGKMDGKEFYFNNSYLEYFNQVPMLYKYDANPYSPIYVKNDDELQGVILPIRITGEREKEVKKSLYEQVEKTRKEWEKEGL